MNEAEIIVDDKVPVLRIIREFDAAPAKVFRAHVEPELFARWNWDDGYSVRFDHFDCRTGGSYRITMSGPEMQGSVHGVPRSPPPSGTPSWPGTCQWAVLPMTRSVPKVASASTRRTYTNFGFNQVVDSSAGSAYVRPQPSG